VRAPVTYIPDYFWRHFFSFLSANTRLWRQNPGGYWEALWFALRHNARHWGAETVKRFLQAGYLAQKVLPGAEVAHFHAHFSHDPTTVAFFASWLTGTSYSISAHAKDIYLQARDFLRRKIAKASFVVTCTEHNREYLFRLRGAASTPILRCYHGADLNYFALPAKPDSRSCPRILSVGRLVPKKGFPVLLQALRMLRQKGWDFRGTIIGNGPMEPELRKQIADLGLDDEVELLSPMPQHELHKHYLAADLFVLACEVQDDGDRDGIPNVIVEAMAMGIPVVSTNISGIPECVDHGVNGMLAPEKNPSALAETMAALLSQPERARQLGLEGRKKVERDFDARRNVAQIGAALRRAMPGTGRLSHATRPGQAEPDHDNSAEAIRPTYHGAAMS
jgi:glycosyltransferase involved in cell wall biosynthesis